MERLEGYRVWEEAGGPRLWGGTRDSRLCDGPGGSRLREEAGGSRLREEAGGARLREEAGGSWLWVRASAGAPPVLPSVLVRLLPGLLLLGVIGQMLLVPVRSAQTGGSVDIPHVLREQDFHYEVTSPSWLWTAAPRSVQEEKFPSRARLKVTVEGTELILELQKNKQLLAPQFTETYYSRSGIPITGPANRTEHCYYHGAVRGLKLSHVVLSTCSGFRGLISLSSNLSYMLEPLPGGHGLHMIYRTDYLKLPEGTCGHHHADAPPEDWSRAFSSGHHRVRREDLQNRKYVELYLVADHEEFQKHEYDLNRTIRKMVEVANYIDKFYKTLNIRVALVGLEVWTDGNKCNVSENPYSTLWSFLAWRRKLLPRKNHDNAQLITGRSFHGTTIGLAPLLAMCSVYQSGGVNMDHSDSSIGIASTMAHEMGHNFGMSHDSTGCCSASPAEGGCIMAAATGHPFPKVFNKCNRKQLERYLQTGGGMCLSNMPDTSTMYGGSRCGNGYLEDGEECDCGEPEECTNPCCNARNCTLRPGAECAHGTCCQQCRLRAPGTLCRKESRACDLPEFCTGKSAFCPPNSYQLDGTACQEGRAYCYSGMCLTHHHQCGQLWGAGARPAPDVCFEKVNAAGDTYGNCGKDTNGKYRMCESSDAKCGKIQCQSSASKPLDSNSVAIDTTVSLDGKRIRCRGTHVYRAAEEDGDILDPGLVMTGTKCGDHHICFEGQCRSTTFFQAEECTTKCHMHGICNNNRNCHCYPGWDPPFCNRTGSGGSVDSGPPPPDGSGSLMFGAFTLALLLILLPGAAFCLYIYKRRDQLKPSNATSIPHHGIEAPGDFSNLEPNNITGHPNPAYKLRPHSKERTEIRCLGTPSAPVTNPRPTTTNALLLSAETPTPGELPPDAARPPSANPGSLPPTDAARPPSANSRSLPPTDAARPPSANPGSLPPTDAARPPSANPGSLPSMDATRPPPVDPEALHHSHAVRLPSVTPGALDQSHAVRQHPQTTVALHQTNAAGKRPCRNPGALQKTDTVKPPSQGLRVSLQTDTVRHPSPKPASLPRTGTITQPPPNPGALARDSIKPTSQHPGASERDPVNQSPPNAGASERGPIRHTSQHPGASERDPVNQTSPNAGASQRDPIRQACENHRASERDIVRQTSPNPETSDQTKPVKPPPPQKPIPPAPALPPPKKFHRGNPPRKPLPAAPVHGPRATRPGTQPPAPPTTARKGDIHRSDTEP